MGSLDSGIGGTLRLLGTEDQHGVGRRGPEQLRDGALVESAAVRDIMEVPYCRP